VTETASAYGMGSDALRPLLRAEENSSARQRKSESGTPTTSKARLTIIFCRTLSKAPCP
jgi:hypothetical protein